MVEARVLEELEESRLCLCLAVGQKKEAHVHGHVIGLVASCHSASCPCDVWETALAVEVNSSAIVAPMVDLVSNRVHKGRSVPDPVWTDRCTICQLRSAKADCSNTSLSAFEVACNSNTSIASCRSLRW